jgi:hypothetical protein
MLLKKIFWFWWRKKKKSDSEFVSYNLMLNSGKKNCALRDKKNNILTLVLSEKKIMNETKNHNPPPFKLNGRSLSHWQTARVSIELKISVLKSADYIGRYKSRDRRDRGSWIYCLCNQCLSPLKLWIKIPLMTSCTWYNIMW